MHVHMYVCACKGALCCTNGPTYMKTLSTASLFITISPKPGLGQLIHTFSGHLGSLSVNPTSGQIHPDYDSRICVPFWKTRME